MLPMARTYEQLSLEERCLIQTQLSMGFRAAAIAAALKRARSTITREMQRNGWRPEAARPDRGRPSIAGGYNAPRADKRARRLRRKPRTPRKLVTGTALWDKVLGHLRRGLSPEQTARTLARMPEPVALSYETIYNALYAMPRGQLRSRILTLLRRGRKQRRAKAKAQRPFVDAITLIDQRPEEVNLRLVPGHWEGDLIKGRLNQSRIGTLVERSTLFVALVKLEDGRAETCANAFARILNRFDAQLRLSLTYDQGREMAAHKSLAQQAGLKIYFAHPHSPWQRGINENTNGLLRQYLPKGQDLSRFSQQQLDEIAWRLNTRPRKSLAWKAPAELFLPPGAFDFVSFWQTTANPVALAP
jgi:IS30 family transposase